MPIKVFSLVLSLVFMAVALPLWAANLVGDADNSGTVEMADAQQALGGVLGSISLDQISPLAYANDDGRFDIADVMLVAQGVNAVRTNTGASSLLSITAPGGASMESSYLAVSLGATVNLNYPLTLVDGLEAVVSLPVSNAEATATTPSIVGTGMASTDLTPISTSGSMDLLILQWEISILDSAGGSTVGGASDQAPIAILPPTCGNLETQPTEDCDDGNDGNQQNDCLDGCIAPTCGDGVVWNQGTGTEPCDDANDGNNQNDCLDGCIAPTCGDGMVWDQGTGTEPCDDSGESAACDIDCTTPLCGDSVLNTTAGEVCDDGNTTSEGEGSCAGDCSGIQSCGDSATNGTEACDDGGANSELADANCRTDCLLAGCGDGVADTGEVCDDDNNESEGEGSCLADCSGLQTCGNGVTEGTENCDDAGESATCNANCQEAFCGDGAINATQGETCENPYITCWGDNTRGQSAPPGGYQFIQVAAGNEHACGLQADGVAVCWGRDNYGQSTVPAGTPFLQVVTGYQHSCGLKGNREAVCWGRNNDGQLNVPANEVFTQISTGGYHVCGLRPDGSAVCWGHNQDGRATPPGGETFSLIALGANHSCGLRLDGTAVCWGADTYGRATPPAGQSFVQLAMGPNHVCGLKADDTVLCWGLDSSGQATPPVGETFTEISAFTNATCGIRPDRTVTCWGDDDGGQFVSPVSEYFSHISTGFWFACGLAHTEDAACDRDCSSPSCGDGVTNATVGEECDDAGESAACDPDCSWAVCQDGYVNASSGETCDNFIFTPSLLGTTDLPNQVWDVAVAGDRAYFATWGSDFQVVDISDPGYPIIGSRSLGGYRGMGVAVTEDRAFVGTGNSTYVIDITDPSYPVIFTLSARDWARGLAVDGGYLYVADGFKGLTVIDITDPTYPTVGTRNTPNDAIDVAVYGGRAYVADLNSGLQVIDITDPTYPIIGSRDTGSVRRVAAIGDILVMADTGTGDAYIIDTTDLAFPVVGTISSSGFPFGVAVSGNRAYLPFNDGNLEVVDLADPTFPIIASYAVGNRPFHAAVAGDRLFVGDFDFGLTVLDITETCGTDCQAPGCGDGAVNAGEECDGDALNHPCDEATCLFEPCGNHFRDTGEACDDGNSISDGEGFCEADCLAIQTCGDGVMGGSEVCDDGAANGTGEGLCLTDCLSIQTCGNGPVEGTETCDDAGESAICDVDCTAVSCGDGLTNGAAGEVCDHGASNGAGIGWCKSNCSGIDWCGDGVVDTGETCDDGASNGVGTGYCLTDCSGRSGCGDSVIEGTEVCDDGANNGTSFVGGAEDTMIYRGHRYGVYSASMDYSTAQAACAADGGYLVSINDDEENIAVQGLASSAGAGGPWLGASDAGVEGVWEWESGEPFYYVNWEATNPDGGSGLNCMRFYPSQTDWDDHDCNNAIRSVCEYPTGYCNADCSAQGVCGDGIAEGSEACDDGPNNGVGNGYCLANCTDRVGCGDGILQGSEVCDDGASNGTGDGFCLSDCSHIEVCGDSITEGTESCDDGLSNGAGYGYCRADCSAIESCGNGVIDGDDYCDDGANNGVTFVSASDVTMTYGGHLYGVRYASEDFSTAQAACASEGGYLASINTDAENTAVRSLATSTSSPSPRLGLTDAAVEGLWIWDSGEPFHYINWGSGEPAGGATEDCMSFVSDQPEWYDETCSATHRNICEYPTGYCDPTCGAFVCGDGIMNGAEACDDGANNGLGSGYCAADCLSRSNCGDGVLEGSEICDDGASNGAAFTCSGATYYYNNHQYCLYATGDTFANAQADCESVPGGHLIVVNNAEENAEAWAQILATFGDVGVWMGYDDLAIEGNWVWHNGDTHSYSNWEGSNPDNGGGAQHCALFWSGHNGEWDDGTCTATKSYLCEYPQGYCNGACGIGVCGDGIAENTEYCDDGPDNGAGSGWCLSDCSGRNSCGNGSINGSEICDDGGSNGSGSGFCMPDCSGIQP